MYARSFAPTGLVLLLAAVVSAASIPEGGKPPAYPWPHLDQLDREFKRIQRDAAPVIALLKELRAQYLTASDRSALLAERAGLRTKLGELLQEGEDVIERYRGTQKIIHVTALTRGIRLKVKDKKAGRTTKVLIKIMRYEKNFQKMKRELAALYGEVSADDREVAHMQAQLAKEANFRLIVGVAGVSVFLAFSFSYWITRRRTSVPTLEAVPYEKPADTEPPRLQAEMPETLGGNFKVLKEIGRGGMGVVYEAMDLALRRKVAIKRMRCEVLQAGKEMDLFLSEARLVASLKHPNLVEGGTLQEILDERAKLPPEEISPILRGVGRAPESADRFHSAEEFVRAFEAAVLA